MCIRDRWKASLFLIGSFLYTGLEETIWMVFGYFHILGVPPTYQFNYFTNGILWFFSIPLQACLGWYFLAYGCFYIIEKVFPKLIEKKWGLIKSASLAGLLAMNIDLLVDPIMVRREAWYWLSAKNETIWILGIPYSNFIGWFLLICLFAIYWTKMTGLREKYGTVKTTVFYFVGLFGLLFGTIFLIMLVTIVCSPLNGLIIGFI